MADSYIEIFGGRLGGGKTYSATVRILEHLAKGGVYYGNVRINSEQAKAYCAEKWGVIIEPEQINVLTNEQIPHFPQYVRGGDRDLPTLVVVDEAHLYFNARDWNKTSRGVLEFLSQARKCFVHLILISQSENNIDKQFRRLIQFSWRFRDMQKFTVPGLGFKWPWAHIMVLCFDAQDPTLCMTRKLIRKDPKIFACYDSTQLLTPIEFGGFEPAKKLKKIPWSVRAKKYEPYLWVGACVSLLLCFVV